MAQGYYSLQEAAQFLGMPADDLKQMAQKNQLRSFQDRGTLRFRIPDIQELARNRGLTSDPDLKLGEPPTPKIPKPAEPPRTPQAKAAAPDVFSFALESDPDRVDVGGGLLKESSSAAKKEPKSDGKKGLSPAPKPSSDSDVKLVAGADQAFTVDGSDSDVKLVRHDLDVKGQATPPARASKLADPRKSVAGPTAPAKPKKSSRLGVQAPQQDDSGVKLVPMDSDSDVKIVGAGSDEITFTLPSPSDSGDSDIRLERSASPPASDADAMMLTEEINLDEEIKKQEAAKKPALQAKVKPKSKVKFPTTSPFELSDSDLDQPPSQAKAKPDSSDFDLSTAAAKPDSSDFDLTAPSDGSLVLEPDSATDDFSLDLPDDSSLTLAADTANLKGPSSGINLAKPGDQGISLEDNENSDMDFELSLDEGTTPKPAPAKDAPDSDSEFELSLDVDDSGKVPAPDSDSEFELTLDDSSGDISGIDGGLKIQTGSESGEKDIFETDFEVPSLEEESGSQVAALDTDLDSSDFDIALDDSGVAADEEESGSQVIALDEEEVDDNAATVAAKRGQTKAKGKSKLARADDDDLGFSAIDVDEDGAAVAEGDATLAGPVREVVREKLIEPAPWGAIPVIFMLPCVVIMFVVALMGFEMVQSSAGHREPGFLTKTIAELMGKKIR